MSAIIITAAAPTPEQEARDATLRLQRFRRAADLARARRLKRAPQLAGLIGRLLHPQQDGMHLPAR